MNEAQPNTDDTTVRARTAGTFSLLCATILSTSALLGTSALLSAPVLAAHKSSATASYFVQAPVLHVEPIVTRRYVDHPVQHCTTGYSAARADDYPRRHHAHQRVLPGLIGGLIGGWVGHQFGGGNGKKALTVLGALTGSSIARNAARHHDADGYHYRDDYRRAAPVQRCRTTYESHSEESIDGYLVTYEYAGRTFEKRVPHHPGDEISIRVRVTPLGV